MTETRKAIIEIIDPYMAKDLSEGCIILGNKLDNNDTPLDDTPIEHITFLKEIEQGQCHSKLCVAMEGKYDVYKIIGHYDITAVLKYINSFKISFGISQSGKNILLSDEGFCNNVPSWIIPHKPLSLYTEQEEKDLLKLLKNLGKQ